MNLQRSVVNTKVMREVFTSCGGQFYEIKRNVEIAFQGKVKFRPLTKAYGHFYIRNNEHVNKHLVSTVLGQYEFTEP